VSLYNGASTGETDSVTVGVDVTGLTGGIYNCELTISDPNAENNPQSVSVSLHVMGRMLAFVPDNFSTIQEAIDWVMDGGVVVVANGTYTGQGNRDLDFRGKAITVKSENGPENCIIDCQGSYSEPHRGFYFHTGEDTNSVLDGFTITNGCAPGHGGGICCIDSSPMIINCIIRGNTTTKGDNNWAYGGDGGNGAGIYCRDSSPRIINCLISDNITGDGGSGIEDCDYWDCYCGMGGGRRRWGRNLPGRLGRSTFSNIKLHNNGKSYRCWWIRLEYRIN
ncbi:MAG: hypothetical protein ACYSWP_03225, partial [Planctomycetota bacterium]